MSCSASIQLCLIWNDISSRLRLRIDHILRIIMLYINDQGFDPIYWLQSLLPVAIGAACWRHNLSSFFSVALQPSRRIFVSAVARFKFDWLRWNLSSPSGWQVSERRQQVMKRKRLQRPAASPSCNRCMLAPAARALYTFTRWSHTIFWQVFPKRSSFRKTINKDGHTIFNEHNKQ